MKFGLRYASLGRYASGPAAVELAQAAEAAGFDSIWTVEHVVVPHGYQSRYPYSETGRMGSGLEDFPIPDPLIWLAYIASATRTLKLGAAILILPQRNPVVTAKAVATLDHLAGGRRVLLGIGVGWLAEEFATLGVPFEDRGPRTDEYVAAMRALWSQERASFAGRFVSFNSHRIHYDRAWAMEAEGYPGLVVHGPLTTTLLIDFARDQNPGRRIAVYTTQARAPLFRHRAVRAARTAGGEWRLRALGRDTRGHHRDERRGRAGVVRTSGA